MTKEQQKCAELFVELVRTKIEFGMTIKECAKMWRAFRKSVEKSTYDYAWELYTEDEQ